MGAFCFHLFLVLVIMFAADYNYSNDIELLNNIGGILTPGTNFALLNSSSRYLEICFLRSARSIRVCDILISGTSFVPLKSGSRHLKIYFFVDNPQGGDADVQENTFCHHCFSDM
jgi:hypothetical protein